jgi:hypothetical protein
MVAQPVILDGDDHRRTPCRPRRPVERGLVVPSAADEAEERDGKHGQRGYEACALAVSTAHGQHR